LRRLASQVGVTSGFMGLDYLVRGGFGWDGGRRVFSLMVH
jgi:hypothetical protein